MTARTLRWKKNVFKNWSLFDDSAYHEYQIGFVEPRMGFTEPKSCRWAWYANGVGGCTATMFGAMSSVLRALGER